MPCPTNSDEPFVFVFISDTQQFRDRHEDIAKTIAYHHAVEPLQFLIYGGDVVQEGAIEQDWIDFFLGGKLYLMDISTNCRTWKSRLSRIIRWYHT